MVESDSPAIENQPEIGSVAPDRPERLPHPLAGIFRAEAIAESKKSLGAPIRQLQLSGWILTLFFLALFLTLMCFLVTARYARTETVVGQTIPIEGSFRITSQLAGIAQNVKVSEGQFVEPGQDIATISANQTLRNGDSVEESLRKIQAIQEHAQEMEADAKLAGIQQQIGELNARADGLKTTMVRGEALKSVLERRLELQRDTLAANRTLAEKGMVSALAVRKEEDALLAIEQQVQQAGKELAQQKSELAQIAPQLGRLTADFRLAQSEAINTKQSLLEKNVNTETHLSAKLRAPVKGYVTALKIHAGSTVAQDETLAVVVPSNDRQAATSLEVELWAPSRAIGFVKPGQKVRVMYDSFPYQSFGVGTGTVKEVAGTPVQPREIPQALEAKEQMFRIRVALDRTKLDAYGQQWPLAPGMRLSADLILEEQSLFDLLLEPLRAVKKRSI